MLATFSFFKSNVITRVAATAARQLSFCFWMKKKNTWMVIQGNTCFAA